MWESTDETGRLAKVGSLEGVLSWRKAADFLLSREFGVDAGSSGRTTVDGAEAWQADILRLAYVNKEDRHQLALDFLLAQSDEWLEAAYRTNGSFFDEGQAPLIAEFVELMKALRITDLSIADIALQLGLEDPTSIADLTVAAMSELESHERNRLDSLEPYKVRIRALVQAYSDGQAKPRGYINGKLHWERLGLLARYVEDEALAHGKLPSGQRNVLGVGTVDFDLLLGDL